MRMLLVLGLMLAILFSSHYYLWTRISSLLLLSPSESRKLILLFLFMIASMIGAMFVQRSNPGQWWSDLLIWIGYTWMGFGFLWIVSTGIGDGFAGINHMLAWLGSPFLKPSQLNTLRLSLWALGTLAGFWGIYNAIATPKVVRIEVPIANLAPELENYRIIQLTDTHLGPILRKDWLAKVMDKVNAEHPDLVVHTGDLIDGSVKHMAPMIQEIRNLKGKDGHIFVTGNHEAYSDVKAWSQQMSEWGWSVLLNQHLVIHRGNACLVIAGVTDAHEGSFFPERTSNPHQALQSAPANCPRILLAHQPKSALDAQDLGIDLQLSGHTHGGQIWPFNFLVRLQQPVVAGLDDVGKVRVYTSRGAGFWGPPMRIGAPAEITEIILKRR